MIRTEHKDILMTCGNTAVANGTWVSGSNLAYQKSNLWGHKVVAAAANVSRRKVCRNDLDRLLGKFSGFFGGFGASNAPNQLLNDLWKYSGRRLDVDGGILLFGPSRHIWRFRVCQPRGTFLAGDILPVGWQDESGKFSWLFRWLWFWIQTLTQGFLNDLWEYSNGQWTWIGGSKVQKTHREAMAFWA